MCVNMYTSMNDILFIMCTSPADKHNTTFIANCQLTSQIVLAHVLVFDPTIPSSSLMYNVETHVSRQHMAYYC